MDRGRGRRQGHGPAGADSGPMLVPALAGGSAEHFYHFLLGYLWPIVRWLEATRSDAIVVRDCGPLNGWFDLLRPVATVQIIAPGQMLQHLVRHEREAVILDSLDDPGTFVDGGVAEFATILRSMAGLPPPAGSDGITVVDRGPALPFYSSPASEIRSAAAGRRSIPNAAEIAAELGVLRSARLVDLADLSPVEQIDVCAGTGLLVGQHGAGLASMVWMPPGAAVLEVHPDSGGQFNHFRLLAAAMGFGYARVDQAGRHAPVPPDVVVHRARALLVDPARGEDRP